MILRRGALLFLKVIRQISRSHDSEKRRVWPRLGVSDCNSSLNSPMATKWCTKLEVALKRCPIGFSRSSVKFQGHTALKIVEFDQNWPFPDSNSSLNTPMATKWCTKLEAALKRCPIVFQGHASNFKGHTAKKSSNLTQIGRFRTVTPVWIHQWLRNYA